MIRQLSLSMPPAMNPVLSPHLLSNGLAPALPPLAAVQLPILPETIQLAKEEDDAMTWFGPLDMASWQIRLELNCPEDEL